MKDIIINLKKLDLKEGEAGLCWLGQHGFLIKLGETIICADAYLTPNPARLVPPLIGPEELSCVDIISGSHDHLDHIDKAAWQKIVAVSSSILFVFPEAVKKSVLNTIPFAPGQVVALNAGTHIRIKGVKITAIPAAHEFLHIDKESGLYPYLGYIFEGNGVTVYHSGDTCIYEGMQGILRQWNINIAMLPINGRDAERLKRGCIGNMTYQEAADLAGSIKPELTIPAHYDMFKGNTIDPELFMAYMKVKYPSLNTVLLKHGEIFKFRTQKVS